MKVAISSKGKDLDSKVSPDLSKTPDLIVYDLEKMSFDVMELSKEKDNVSDTIKHLSDNSVKSLITCRCNKLDLQKLKEKGITVYLANTSSVRSLVQKYKNNTLKELGPNNIQQ